MLRKLLSLGSSTSSFASTKSENSNTSTRDDVDFNPPPRCNNNDDVPKKKIPLKQLTENVLLDFPNSDDDNSQNSEDEGDSDGEGCSVVTHSSLFSGSTLYSSASFSISTGTSALSAGASIGTGAGSETNNDRRLISRRRRRLRSKDSVRLAVLKVNRRLLSLLNQDLNQDSNGDQNNTGSRGFSERIMSRESSSRSIATNSSKVSMDSSNNPIGLPGFLRRSLRTFDDDQSVSGSVAEANRVLERASSALSEDMASKSDPANIEINAGSSTHTNGIMGMARSASTRIRPVSSSNSMDSSAATASVVDENQKAASDKVKSYKETTFENCIKSQIVDLRDLRKLGWNGIPPQYRAEAWQILLGYLPGNSSRRKTTLERKRQEYRDAIAQHYDIDDRTRTVQEQETLRQVLVDVPRTAPDIGLFRSNRIRRILARLLYIWAMRHPASSYVQGINDLVTPLIAVFLSSYYGGKDVTDGAGIDEVSDKILFQVEADSYWCLTKLLAGIQDHYTSDQPGVQRMVFRLEELVKRIDSDLCDYLHSTGIEFMQFSFKWMNCLLLREFSLQCIMRLWDTYFSEGDGGFENFHVYVCAAFLCQFSAEIQEMEFDELFGFMQNTPTEDWGDVEIEVLLSQAFVLSTLFGGSDAHLTN